MARVRLGLGKLSVTDKIARGRHIVTRLTNNAAFPNPHPPLTEVTTALDELEAASAQVQSAKSEVTTRVSAQDNAARKVDQVLARLGSYVESVAGSDDTLITAAGMEAKVIVRPRRFQLRLKELPQPRVNTKARSFCRGNRSRTPTATSLNRVSILRVRRVGRTLALLLPPRNRSVV
jgi:hypothetical protein